MRNKQRINWTIDQESIDLLKQARKINGKNTTLSSLVEYAIKQTYRNKKEYYRERMKHHQIKLMEYKDKLEAMESE